ncbi:FtsK/SpoIIIE domain-containing protein [Nocardioides zeae]|uniref:S-DNA-T family DNA segregation ATPase FtsK/SpoIIIE n=1 Tax=Nocardioides zeae TaxID=1457234 RepID=A0AAJ1WYV9_9ACTN|nr:FtsK/SpoIIIE domain-containing protein [Nocardioides zeae]MDQ1103028.1 S-DNA-T family DNA segregation ATPase FtsK/SpoIIIE [Nocardioides zeae]
MQQWTLSLSTPPESGLPSVDVVVHAKPEATVADLARAFGRHLAPHQAHLLLVPVDGGHPWPADRALTECGLRTGDLLDVVTAPASWLHRHSSTSRPRAVLRVVDGPDSGQRLQVRSNALTVGRGTTCTMRLTDPLVSTQHVRVVLGTRPTVYDAGSANGTTVAGEQVTTGREVDWGTPIRLGRTTVVVDPGEVPVDDTAVSVFRPPRFGEPLLDETLDVPSPPTRNRPSPLPWAMLALPMIMGLAIFARSQTPYALVYMLAWPVFGYLGWRQQQRAARLQFEEEAAEWRTDVDGMLALIDDQARRQREQVHDDYPDAETLRTRAAQRDPYLWARSETRTAFLHTRLGIGTVPALLRGDVKDGGDRPLRREVAAELDARATLPDMPVVVDLTAHGLLALTGEVDAVDALVRALSLRLAFDHSPADLTVAACLGRGRAHHEAWLRWLPHATTRVGGEPPVAIGPGAATALLDHLASEDGGRGHTLCIIDEDAGIPRRTVEAVAAVGAERGLHLLWLGRRRAEVPAATGLLVDLDDGSVNVGDRGGVDRIDTPDAVTLAHAWRSARTMTAYVDEAAVLPASTSIPAVVRLPEVSGDLEDLDDTDAVLRRWGASRGLRAQIGAGVDGTVTIDLRDDGPHGLVAGTTGSGKSELLQTLICSLALNNPVNRISFLLVDYKGGAAFRECADLPHTVGYITDLTPALVQRALTSLGAEITAREHLLGEYGVKDLTQLEREHPDKAPPSLLICVDEFAALTAEVPDFVDGMVNIAQRGRSLGMHVLLATQRPAGVVTGNIRANTDLRIALRVSAADDSRDVIDSPEAARISRRTPGRAWLRRTGHGTAELVQSAWTGARQPIDGTGSSVTVHAFSAASAARADTAADARLDPRTDLERCVTTIVTAFRRSGVPAPPKPWLPPLPAELLLDLDELRREAGPQPSGHLHLGGIDDPAHQRQPRLDVDLTSVGHLLVHGASGSGKTELLRTAAVTASVGDAWSAHGVAPYVYAIDYAGGGLQAIADLPTVEAVVGETQLGRVLRLVRLLKRTVADRSAALASNGCADLEDLARAGHVLPRVYLLLDNLPAVLEAFEKAGGLARDHVEHLQNVLQNGRRVGVHVVATAPGRTGVPTSIAASFGRRIILRMTTNDDYLMLGAPGNVLDAETTPGTGLLGKQMLQVATTGGAGTPVQAERMREVAALLEPRTAGRGSAAVPPMPARLPADALPSPQGSRTPLAVDADAVGVLTVDLLGGPVVVAGRAGTGRTSALEGVVELAARSDVPPQVVRAETLLEAVAAAEEALARASSVPAGTEGSWVLLVADDVQRWDAACTDDAHKAARTRLLELLDAAGGPLAAVVSVDVAEARRPGMLPGLVTALKQRRRGFLLHPEWNEGDVFGVTVPTKTLEPLTGPGRGLWCEAGSATVAQLVATTHEGQDGR